MAESSQVSQLKHVQYKRVNNLTTYHIFQITRLKIDDICQDYFGDASNITLYYSFLYDLAPEHHIFKNHCVYHCPKVASQKLQVEMIGMKEFIRPYDLLI